MATDSVPPSPRKRTTPEAVFDAEDMAIKAHHSLVSLGYGEEIGPLRLPNRRGTFAIIFASIAAVLYGIGGFIFGMEANSSFKEMEFLFHFFDHLTIAALIVAGISVCMAVLGLLKKHSSKIRPVVSFVILMTAPLVLHILGVTAGLMIP